MTKINLLFTIITSTDFKPALESHYINGGCLTGKIPSLVTFFSLFYTVITLKTIQIVYILLFTYS